MRKRKEPGGLFLQNEFLVSETFSADPFALFGAWLERAFDRQPVANAMSLATATSSGETSLRTVLLKAYGDDGFLFFTSPGTRKVRQMTENPHVSLLFFWPELNRQIRIDGMAARIPTTAFARRFFATGHHAALTWVSPRGHVADARQALAATMVQVRALLGRRSDDGGASLSVSSVLVTPITIEFWQGSSGSQHTSLIYRRSTDGWEHHGCGSPEVGAFNVP